MSHSPATLWSRAFLGELYSWGVRDVVLSPGARSQALALAALEWERATEGELRVHVVIDERSAAFRALGIAAESGSQRCVSPPRDQRLGTISPPSWKPTMRESP
jgi:2-succinyl-5-enolpyruvyl-6-hydroxy-3-cyclohexene-1-carboxylate synthase